MRLAAAHVGEAAGDEEREARVLRALEVLDLRGARRVVSVEGADEDAAQTSRLMLDPAMSTQGGPET